MAGGGVPAAPDRQLCTRRREIDVRQARLQEARARLESLPHRRRYFLLTHDLGLRLLDAQREWLDEVERELGARTRPPRSTRRRRDAGVDRVGDVAREALAQRQAARAPA
jgi:Virulence activator alpha C-term